MNEYLDLFGTFAKVGVMTFGGGYAMLPILQREVVEHKGWATEEELMDYFAIGQCTPGVIAVNTATFIGQKHRGWLGGIVATLGVVFPSLIIISILAGLITNFSHLAWVQNAFAGIQVCVCVLIFNAVLKLLKKSVVDKRTAAIFLIVMALLAAVVYAALHFFEAGYGYLFDRRYGPPVPNRVGWMVMESPVFILMCVLWASSERMWQAGPLALFCLFQAHYLQRAFIFPLLIRGKGRMPLGIVVMGMVFNTLNALMQGGWIFYVSPADYYAGWFAQPYIYIGGALFGIWFATRIKEGKDLTAPMNRLLDWVVNQGKRKPKMRVTYKRPETDYEYNARKHRETVDLDAILDKLKRSGYESLSAEEKKKLFDASKK